MSPLPQGDKRQLLLQKIISHNANVPQKDKVSHLIRMFYQLEVFNLPFIQLLLLCD